jgi:epoxyqueuosine reductase
VNHSLDLDLLASLTRDQFRERFRHTPIWRAHWEGLLRNVATVMGNTRNPKYRPSLERLAAHPDPAVAEHARWALSKLEDNPCD